MANSECLCLAANTVHLLAILPAIRDSSGGVQPLAQPRPFLEQCSLPPAGMALIRLAELVVAPTLHAHRHRANRALAVFVALPAWVVLDLLLHLPTPSTKVSIWLLVVQALPLVMIALMQMLTEVAVAEAAVADKAEPATLVDEAEAAVEVGEVEEDRM